MKSTAVARAAESVWSEQPGSAAAGVARLLLWPAELGFRGASRTFHAIYDRGWRTPELVGVPVVSIGNLTVGGSGKTPLTRWVVETLRRRGRVPAVLHGGYAEDEPALHRHWYPDVPVIARRDRVAGAAEAIAAGADVLVLDDAFQHRRLARDLDIVVVPAESWTRAPRLLPRGPWREPPAALARAHAAIVSRKVATPKLASQVAGEVGSFLADGVVAVASLTADRWRAPDGSTSGDAPEGPSVAVAAIGQPSHFVEQARSAGAAVDDVLLFRDHHAYDSADAERIQRAAGERHVVTTAKDWVKLHRLGLGPRLWVLEQRVEFEAGEERLLELLGKLGS